MMLDHQHSLSDEQDKIHRKNYSNMYFITSGTADVVMIDSTNKNKEVVIAELRPGEIFGVSDLLRITVSKKC